MTTNNLPKYFDGSDKMISTYTLKYDNVLGGYVMFAGTKDTGNYITTGSQRRGTQQIKVYKTVASAQKAFAKMHDDNNQSKYVKHYYQLVVA